MESQAREVIKVKDLKSGISAKRICSRKIWVSLQDRVIPSLKMNRTANPNQWLVSLCFFRFGKAILKIYFPDKFNFEIKPGYISAWDFSQVEAVRPFSSYSTEYMDRLKMGVIGNRYTAILIDAKSAASEMLRVSMQIEIPGARRTYTSIALVSRHSLMKAFQEVDLEDMHIVRQLMKVDADQVLQFLLNTKK